MAERVVRGLLALVLAGVLAGCGSSGDAASGSSTRLTGTVLDPPFEVSSTPLQTTEGASFSLVDDTDAPLTLVFFGYTNCPDICGQVMATLAGAMTRLSEEDHRRVDVVLVTTDPARDTPEVITDYVRSFDPDFTGLTGDLDDIIEVGRSVGVGVETGERLPSGGYEVTHGTQVIAIDESDTAPVYWKQDVSQTQLAADVHTLLNEG